MSSSTNRPSITIMETGDANSFFAALTPRGRDVLSHAKIQKLATLAANLRHGIKRGMTKKNRGSLRQFEGRFWPISWPVIHGRLSGAYKV
jgi:hypothetical protein